MDTSSETREAAINRIRKLWSSDPGAYWDELRKAELTTVEVFTEHAMKDSIVLPNFEKDLRDSKKKGK